MTRSDPGFDDTFGGDAPDPSGYGPGLHIDARILVTLIVLGLAVLAASALVYYTGRQRGRRRLAAQRQASAEAIYKSVRWHLDRALKSSGGVILERAREVAEVLEARLGFVIALNAKPGKIVGELDAALKGEKPSAAPDPTPKVKVAMATEAHYLEVWKALQGLNKLWQDKPAVMALIRAAQDELAAPPKPEKAPVRIRAEKPNAVKEKSASAAKPVPVATAAAAPAPSPDLAPTPPPPAPAPKRGKKLPAHKRNMLA
ncbi:MAG: hypothetical protein JF615_06125 [Asticcacaulis sp.]|nr:hypothetical protein [Asticcacaulis sp.]